ncbi:hypothetical protein Q3G72_013057 [Acer saccharum]|nr:hypothetical protein Q3G72_013057 [Acer saccharum]
MAWTQIINNAWAFSSSTALGLSRFFSSKSSNPYIVKVGIPEFLNGIGNGVETHVPKLESEIGDFQRLLVTRTLKLKKLGIPCKHSCRGFGGKNGNVISFRAVLLCKPCCRPWYNGMPYNSTCFLNEASWNLSCI